MIALGIGAQCYGGFNQYSIGLNLGSNDANNGAGARALNPTDSAGLPAVSQVNWNNLPSVSGNLSGGSVVDNAGNVTQVGVTWASALGTWSSGGNNQFPTNAADHTLMMGYLDNGGTATVNITNLPSQLTANGYDVYVYALFDTPNRGGFYSIVDGLNTSTVLRPAIPLNSDSTPTNYVQSPGLPSNYTGNYLVFHGLTNANIQLVAVATNTGTTRAIICGVQLVSAPETGEAGAATGLNIATNGQDGQLVISWLNGASSQGALVVMRQGLPVTAKPVDGQTYAASVAFGQGANLGDDEFGAGNFAVFSGPTSGTTTSVTVSNLTPTQTYYVAVYSSVGSGGSSDYTLASPAAGSAVATGAATNILLTVPSTVVASSARHYKVQAQYANGTASDITTVASVTSSNSAIVSIVSPGRIGANASGTVGLKAVSGTFTNIQLVTVVSMAMTYQWSFNDPVSSLTVTDTLSGAVGLVSNSPSTGPNGAGQLAFDGSAGYVTLPANILSSYGAVTIETWVSDAAPATWQRIWDFGNNTTVYMFETPTAGPFYRTAFTVGGGGAETQVNAPFGADTAQHHYVFTLSGATHSAKLFLDGFQVGVNTNFLLTPEDIGPTALNYLGKSQYAVDPYLNGTMDEFRIYNGAVDALQIAVDAATGPDVIVATNALGTLTNLSVSAGSPLVQFGFEQVGVTGLFANVTSPINLESAPQTTYTTSDPNILTVSPVGLISATGPGIGTVTVVSFGLTQSVQVVVTPLPPGMTHRWPFNTDFNDVLDPNTPAVPHNTVGLDGSGNAVLDGTGAANATTGSYIELPGNILLGYSSIALEAWYTDESGDGTGINRNWARIWDFGSGPGNNLFLTPFVGGEVDTMRLALNLNGAGEWQVQCVRPLTNVEHHIVFVEDASNHVAYLYVDGTLAAQNRDFQARPRDLGLNPNDWLGRSQYGDPLFQGLIDEFRIYNGTLDAVQVGIDFVTGPNNVMTNPGVLVSVSVALTTNMTAGTVQPAHALATFASVANVPVTAANPTWSSSDPTVARVDNYGRVTAIAAGSANISATFRSTTGVATVIVSAAPLPTLLHRYSFDLGDATDSVAGSNGVVTGTPGVTPIFTNGMASIVDNNGYIQLPGHLFDTNLEVTLETWCIVASTTGSGSRMCDFGTSITGPSAFSIAPSANGNNFISFRQSPDNAIGTPAINSWGRAAFATTNHYAIAVSDINRRVDIYLNGVLKDSFPYNTQPDELMGGNVQFRTMLGYQYTNQTEGWFGKNVGGTTGSGWRGSIDEFRIWGGAMNKIQAQVSYQKGPENPQVDPGALQSLSVTLNDSSMVLGSLQRPTVSGTFANTTGSLDLTAFPGVVFTSDNAGVVAVVNGGDTKLQAVGLGTAHIVGSYQGLSVTNPVTVIAKPQAVVTHRYSFRGNANDSVGHATANLFGNATISGGKLVLDGSANPPSYARLPNDLISGYDLVTLEMFYSASAGSSGTQQRLWDFGDHVVANGGITGAGYLYEAAGRGAAGLPNASPGAAETAAIAPNSNQSAFNTNTVHVAVTVDSVNHILSLYTNGVLSITATNPVVDLSLVVDNFNNLGRSQWADPAYNGSIDEFRIYYGLLTPAQVSASYAAGPDPDRLTATVGPGAGQVTISWPATLVTTAYSLQFATSLTPSNWQPAGAPTQVGGVYEVTVASGGAPKFFRLIK